MLSENTCQQLKKTALENCFVLVRNICSAEVIFAKRSKGKRMFVCCKSDRYCNMKLLLETETIQTSCSRIYDQDVATY